MPRKKLESNASESKYSGVSMSTSELIHDFNKRFGEGTFFTFEDVGASTHVYPISTGIPSVDYASGIGGLPAGRIVEIYGPESSGKTTLSLYVIAQFQKLCQNPDSPFFGKRAAYIDAEHSLDPLHVAAIGVDVSSKTGMLINQPDSGEQAFDLLEAICLSNQFGIAVVDSVAALTPMKELENSMDYNPIGLQARMMSQGLRKLKGLASKHNVMVIFINQLREKMVMMGNPETTPGGRALRFYASVRMDVRRKVIDKSGVNIGQHTTVKFVKNKVSRPFTVSEYDYYYDTGVDIMKDIMNVAVEQEVIKRAGAWYYIGEDNKNPMKDKNGNELKWQGKESLFEVLKASPKLYNYIYQVVQGNIPKDSQMVIEDDSQDDESDLEETVSEEVISEHVVSTPNLFD
jgi:recombination protein RecA